MLAALRNAAKRLNGRLHEHRQMKSDLLFTAESRLDHNIYCSSCLVDLTSFKSKESATRKARASTSLRISYVMLPETEHQLNFASPYHRGLSSIPLYHLHSTCTLFDLFLLSTWPPAWPGQTRPRRRHCCSLRTRLSLDDDVHMRAEIARGNAWSLDG